MAAGRFCRVCDLIGSDDAVMPDMIIWECHGGQPCSI
jgi:hypothetical protein